MLYRTLRLLELKSYIQRHVAHQHWHPQPHPRLGQRPLPPPIRGRLIACCGNHDNKQHHHRRRSTTTTTTRTTTTGMTTTTTTTVTARGSTATTTAIATAAAIYLPLLWWLWSQGLRPASLGSGLRALSCMSGVRSPDEVRMAVYNQQADTHEQDSPNSSKRNHKPCLYLTPTSELCIHIEALENNLLRQALGSRKSPENFVNYVKL